MSNHEQFMRRAIELSRKASIIEQSGGAFGAVIVKDNKIIAEGYNQVIKNNDPTWHAEIHAIREAARYLSTPHLEGCIMYTSAECCPMCLASAYWARLDHIYYAATINDALAYGDFKDSDILKEIRQESHERQIKSTELLRTEALEVWKEFAKMPNRARY